MNQLANRFLLQAGMGAGVGLSVSVLEGVVSFSHAFFSLTLFKDCSAKDLKVWLKLPDWI